MQLSPEEMPPDHPHLDHTPIHADMPQKKPDEEDLPVNTHSPPSFDQAEDVSNPKIILTETHCYAELGYSFSSTKKWTIIMVIFLVQTSMNFNTSLYSNAVAGI